MKKSTSTLVLLLGFCALLILNLWALWSTGHLPATLNKGVMRLEQLLKKINSSINSSTDDLTASTPTLVEQKVLESSRLPLKQTLYHLAGLPPIGGAILAIEDQLIVMDRLGSFYLFKDGTIKKLGLKPLPNQIEQFNLHSPMAGNPDAMRAHSFAFDKPRSRLYVSFTQYLNPQNNQWVIASIPLNPQTLESNGEWKTLWHSQPISSKYTSQGGGGKVLIENQHLYFSVGYSDESLMMASQDPSSSHGKIYEADLTNPHVTVKALGFRNVQGMTLGTKGQLWGTDQGPQGGDEINLIHTGKNYGWPYQSYGTDYGKYNRTVLGQKAGITPLQTFEEPIYAFVPSVGLSSIVSIHDFNPQWDEDFLLGSLKAQTLYHIKIYHDHVILAEPLWIGHRIRDITIWQKKIVIKTDDSALIFLELDQKALLTNTKSDDLFFDNALKKCLICHSFQPTNPTSSAPTLLHIYNRAIGQDNFSRYSSALKNKSGRWSADNLSQFIANPSQFAPGTTMPSLGLSNQEIRDVVKLLEKYQ